MTRFATLTDDEAARIEALPLLAALDDDARRLVLGGFERVEHDFGDEIVREGEAPDGFYVVHEGSVRVSARLGGAVEVALTVLHPGDTFGEAGVLTGEPSTATLRARGPVVVLRLDLGVALALVRSHPEVRTAFETEGRARVLGDFLGLHPAFSTLPRAALARLVDDFEEVVVPRGTTIIREGEAAGPMYLVADGKVRARQGPAGAERDIRYLRSGAVFGELSLHRGTPRTATVEAVSDTTLLALGEVPFRRLVAEHPTFRARLEEQVAAYDDPTSAPIPLDFAEILAPVPGEAPTIEDLDLTGDGGDGGDGRGGEAAAVGVPIEALPAGGAGAPPPRGGRRRRRRFPLVRQIDEADCGVAALGMVCRHFGREVSSSFLRHHVGTGAEGTTLRGIQRGGEQAGLVVRAVKASADRLDQLPLPAILHWGGNHWVVLHDLHGDRAHLADPARGLRTVRRSELAEHWSGYAALPSPTPALAEAPLQRSDPRWILGFARPYRRTFVAVFLLSLFASATAMLVPVLSQRIVDDVIVERDRALLHRLTAGTVVLLLASMGAQLVRRRLLVHATLEIDGAAIDHVSGRMLDLPLGYFEGRRFADIERRLGGVSQIRALVVEQSLGALGSVLTLVVAIVVMVAYSWPLALAFVAITPIYAGLMRYSSTRLRPVWEGMEEAAARHAGRQLDAIEGIATVKVMGAEPVLRGGLRTEFRRLAGQMRDADLQVMKYEALVAGVSMLSSVLFLWLGALAVLRDDLTIGELLSFNAILLMTAGPVASLLGLWDQWTYAAVLLHRIQDVFDTPPEMEPGEERRPVPSISGAVTLRNVSFAYPRSPGTPVIDDVSLDVPAGTTVAVVGRSGSGKSTLLKLIAGLLEPSAGTVAFDGVDIRQLDLRQLRSRLGVVLQQPFLFDTTLVGNIAFGDPTPDLDEVRRAAAIADIAPFIEGLPLGYETRVGASGTRLSGGQEQRVAIARALYRSPTVLLLDEATSSLDTESERAVQRNLDRLLHGRTGFVIAHRLSTVRDADLIVVVERGRIAESGTHEELVAAGGVYAHLYAVQLPS